MTMLPSTSYRALAPTSRSLYHRHTTYSLGVSSDACAGLCLVTGRREIHHTPNAAHVRRHLHLRNPTSYSANSALTLTTARHRSTWGRDWNSHWGFRHRPDCTWVRSTAEPASTPADQDCPACQENQRRPSVLSPRELLWQKKVEHMRQWVEKDPYDVLFGRSNDRISKTWHGWRILQPKWPFIHTQAQKFSLEKCHDENNKSSANVQEKISKEPEGKISKEPEIAIHPVSRSVMDETLTASAPNSQASATEWQFDPITMRRVPKLPSIVTDEHASSSNTIDIPVKTFIKSQPAQSHPSTTDKGSIASQKEQKASTVSDSQPNSNKSRTDAFLEATRERARINQSSGSVRGEYRMNDLVGDISRLGLNTASVNSGLKENLESSYQAWRGTRLGDRAENGDKNLQKHASKQSPILAGIEKFSNNSSSLIASTQNPSAKPASKTECSNNTKSQTKEVLEQSWAKVRDARRKRSEDTALYTAMAKTEQLKQELGNISQLVQQQAHFRNGAQVEESIASRRAYSLMNKRDRPYKHMSAREFGIHKSVLLRSWTRKHQEKSAESAAQKMLNAEVEAQKAAMFAHENKWSKSKPSECIETTQTTQHESLPSQNNKASRVENAKDYEERMENRALVREITSIYENTYGTIDKDHRQGRGALDGCLSDYESKLGSGCYNFRSGQDNFEQVAKNSSGNPIISALANMDKPDIDAPSGATLSPSTPTASAVSQPTGYEEYDQKHAASTYTFKSGQDDLEQELKTKSANPYAQAVAAAAIAETSKANVAPGSETTGYEEHDRKMGANPYIFVSGADNLEQELKTKSANPYAEAVSIAKETNTPLLTRMEQRYKIDSQVEPNKPEYELPKLTETFCPPSTTAESNQVSAPIVEKSSDPHLYQILAYDNSDHAVHTASASSSFSPPTGETVLGLSDALTRLNAPAKFLPYLAKHQANGYEIVSANRNLLVLKRMRDVEGLTGVTSTVAEVQTQEVVEEAPLPELVEPKDRSTSSYTVADADVNPVDGTHSYRSSYSLLPQTGNFASPTGFVNHDIYPPLTEHEPVTIHNAEAPKASTKNNTVVRKEEPVFSGAQRRWDDKNTTSPSSKTPASNTTEEIPEHDKVGYSNPYGLLSSVVVLFGVLYAVGVVTEKLRSRPSREANDANANVNADGQRSHGAGSSGLGLTDRAVWTPTSAAPRKDDGAKASAAANPLAAAVASRSAWSTPASTPAGTKAKGSVAAAAGVGDGHEEVVHAAQWVGVALCVYSIIGLALQLISSE